MIERCSMEAGKTLEAQRRPRVRSGSVEPKSSARGPDKSLFEGT